MPRGCIILDNASMHNSQKTRRALEALGERGHRDTLVITFRAYGFQGPAVHPEPGTT